MKGQARHWFYEHSPGKELFDFYVAGLYFTATYGVKGNFNISGTVPVTPLITP